MNDFLDRLLSASAGHETPGGVQPRSRSRFEAAAPLAVSGVEFAAADLHEPHVQDRSAPRPLPAQSALPDFRLPTAPPMPARALVDAPPETREIRPATIDVQELPALVEPRPLAPAIPAAPPAPPSPADEPGPPVVVSTLHTERVTTRLEHIERLANAPAPPALEPAQPLPEAEPKAPVVRVAIGRIEVHAPAPPPAPRPAVPPAPSRRVQPVRSLDAYLKNRNEGRR